MTRKQFGALVRRAQAGDAVAVRELRSIIDGPEGRTRRWVGTAAVVEGRLQSASVSRSPGSGDSQLRIDRDVLWSVRELLGITKAVTIRWVAAEDIPGRNGEHEFTAEGEHLIRLRVGRSAEDTNRTALHELEHAAAAEAYRSRWRWARAVDADPQRYEDNAYEVARLLDHMKVVTA